MIGVSLYMSCCLCSLNTFSHSTECGVCIWGRLCSSVIGRVSGAFSTYALAVSCSIPCDWHVPPLYDRGWTGRPLGATLSYALATPHPLHCDWRISPSPLSCSSFHPFRHIPLLLGIKGTVGAVFAHRKYGSHAANQLLFFLS